MSRTIIVISILMLLVIALSVSHAVAAVPQLISYQGRLTNGVGAPIDTTADVVFRICSDSLGVTELWTEMHSGIVIQDGLFQALLGSFTPLAQSVFDGSRRWLSVHLKSGPEPTELVPLVSMAYAYRTNVSDTASLAKSVADNSITSAKIVNGTIQLSDIGQNSAANGEVIKWNGSAWEAQADATGSNTSGWTDGGTVVSLTTSADTVAINTSLRLGKLNIGGNVGISAQSSIYWGTDSTFIKGFAGGDMTLQGEDIFEKTTGSVYFADVVDGNFVEIDNANELVGVGTTAPDERLQVENDAASGRAFLQLETSHATSFGETGIRFKTPQNTWHLRMDDYTNNSLADGALGLRSQVGVEAMTWLENGNVGIGTTSPGSHKLYVDGTNSGYSGSALYARTEHASGVAANCYANSTYPTVVAYQKGTGDIFRGYAVDASDVSTIVARIKADGRVVCPVLELTGGSDIAEPFEMTDGEALPVGALVVIDANNPGSMRLADLPYDTRVAGVISGAGGVNPGMTLSQRGVNEGGQNVAISGRVYCLADARYGAIKPGDLLTTSATKGHAMVASDRDKAYGTVIGKAMSSLESGTALVLILVSLQ